MLKKREWLTSQAPFKLLDSLPAGCDERKKYLLAAGCVRQVCWHTLTDQRSRQAVETVERFADGLADAGEVESATSTAGVAWRAIRDAVGESDPASVAAEAATMLSWRVMIRHRHGHGGWDVLRDVIHLLAYPPHGQRVRRGPFCALVRDVFGHRYYRFGLTSEWLTTDVVSLARGIYDDHAFDRMPILADALQDAGCDSADALAHCRGPGPHCRGCWVLDRLLGKTPVVPTRDHSATNRLQFRYTAWSSSRTG